MLIFMYMCLFLNRDNNENVLKFAKNMPEISQMLPEMSKFAEVEKNIFLTLFYSKFTQKICLRISRWTVSNQQLQYIFPLQ